MIIGNNHRFPTKNIYHPNGLHIGDEIVRLFYKREIGEYE